MQIKQFEDLVAWQEARKLVHLIYQMTRKGLFTEDRELVRQMRRAAISVMANIAEGFSRYSFKDSKQFFMTSRSSLAELRSHTYVAIDQCYITKGEATSLQEQMEKVGRLTSGLIRNAKRQLEVLSAFESVQTR